MTMLFRDSSTVPNPAASLFVQDVLDNADGSLGGLWLPGSFYNRTRIEGVATKDYSPHSRHLTALGTPTVAATFASIAPGYAANLPTQYYDAGLNAPALADGANRSIGSIAFSGLPSNGETVTIGATAITFVTSGAAGNQINIAGSTAAQATALRDFINAHSAALGVTAYVATATVFLFGNALGAAGDIALAEAASNTTASGAALTNGAGQGLTLFAVARCGASGKFSPIGTWDTANGNHVSLGMWATAGSGSPLNEGVSAYHHRGPGQNQRAYVPAEAAQDGTNFIFGAAAFANGEAWAYRSRSGGTLASARNSTGTPSTFPSSGSSLILGAARGSTPTTIMANGGDVAMAWLRNRFCTPAEVAVDYAAAKAFLAALDAPIAI